VIVLDRLITASAKYRWLNPFLMLVGLCASCLLGADLLRDNDFAWLRGLAEDRWIIPSSVAVLWTIIGLWILSAFPGLPLTSDKPEGWWPSFKYYLKRGFGYLLFDVAALLLIVSLYTSYRMLAFWL
tara:strand:+ start:6974 stop:7354 length:381 start_codon:yes stop_codon:yes gene_type:complete